jgi:3',5'-cyclic AMP phosphodiesterase CpdA
MRLAFTADLHWGHRVGDEATRRLADFLRADPPDVLVLAGDLGTGPHFTGCLELFAGLPGRKALTPGNHDLWAAPDAPHDSLWLYEQELPRVSAAHNFHYLDHGPLLLPEADLALVGTVNWYDYSWALDELTLRFPEELPRLQSKRFTRGRHNDAQFVRWPLDDVRFTARVAAALSAHLDAARAQASRIIVAAHHPPFRGLGVPDPGPPHTLDWLLWEAFCGNRTVEELLTRHADRVPLAFCGHTHHARENTLGTIRGYNIGGDYKWKRLLLVEWPAMTVTAHEFGD